jgi:hypothetical protein
LNSLKSCLSLVAFTRASQSLFGSGLSGLCGQRREIFSLDARREIDENNKGTGEKNKKLCMILPLALILCFMGGCQDKAVMA